MLTCRSVLFVMLTVLLLAPASALAAEEVGSFVTPTSTAVVGESFPVLAQVDANTTDAYVEIAASADPGNSNELPGCGDDVTVLPVIVLPGEGPHSFQCTADASALPDGNYSLSLFVATDDTAVVVDSIVIVIDTVAPAGGSVTHQQGVVLNLPILVFWQAGSDAHPGGELRIERRSADLAGNVCGPFAFDAIVAEHLRVEGSSGIFEDTTATRGRCYRYVLYDGDVAGNTARIESAQTSQFIADITPPTVPTGVIIDTEAATGAHVATLPLGTGAVRVAWNASTDSGGMGVGAYQWCLIVEGSTPCAAPVRSGGGTALFELSASTPELQDGVSYVACVRAQDLANNWSGYGCSPASKLAAKAAPPETTCVTKVGAAMARSVGISQSYIYTLGDWASCAFPKGNRIERIEYTLCVEGSASTCYRVTHRDPGASTSSSSRGVSASGLPLVGGEVFGTPNDNPSVRLFSNTKKAHVWIVNVSAFSKTRSVELHSWKLGFGTAASSSCDQSLLTVIADAAPNGAGYSAAAAMACPSADVKYTTRMRSPWASAVVLTTGSARYTATAPTAASDSFAILAELGGRTFERNVVVQFTRYATGTGGSDTMIGSNTNSLQASSARAKRLTARGDVLLGGGGNDVIHGRGGDDRIQGQNGDDVLHPGAGANITEGGAGNDRIFVISAKDVVSGGAGNDTITVTAKFGPKRITCGAGRDTVIAFRKLRLPKDCERLVIRKR